MPRTVRSVALVVALFLGVAPLLPEEHVHLAGVEGRTHAIAHSHWLEDAQPTGSAPSFAVSHGDHGRAIFLTQVYDGMGRVLVPPVALAAGVFVAAPDLSRSGLRHGESAHQIHAPPGRVWLTRGPPFLS